MENLLLITDLPFDDLEAGELNAADIVGSYQRRILLEKLIQKALKNKSFQVWYQPIWDRHTGQIHSAEALIRLIDEEHGFISPEELDCDYFQGFYFSRPVPGDTFIDFIKGINV